MSKPNKANKNNYTQAGRLTPDEMAHERVKQGEISGRAKGKENIIGKIPARPAGPAGRESNRPRNEPEE